MSERTPEELFPSAECAISRADGGLVPEMDVFTPAGPCRVDDLAIGDSVYALNPETGMMKLKAVVALEQITPSENLIALETSRAAIHVSPNQPIYYCTRAIDRPRTVAASDLTERAWYKFINTWRSPPGQRLDTVDITDLTAAYQARFQSEEHGNAIRATLPDGCEPIRNNAHTGYYFDSSTFKQYQDELESLADSVEISSGSNSRGRPYRFNGDDFIEFLGWFITEGSIHWTENTAQISIAQDHKEHRATIQALFERLGIAVSTSEKRFQFGSTVFGELLERLCGARSADRQLPWFIWDISIEQKRRLLETLVAGDGDERGTYYTSSEQLATDVLRLATELGIKPRYSRQRGTWQVFLNETNDGFQSEKNVRQLPDRRPLIRLTIEDFPAILAGMQRKFQWIGVSKIA